MVRMQTLVALFFFVLFRFSIFLQVLFFFWYEGPFKYSTKFYVNVNSANRQLASHLWVVEATFWSGTPRPSALSGGKETIPLQEAFTVPAKRKLRPQVEAGSYEAAKCLQNKHWGGSGVGDIVRLQQSWKTELTEEPWRARTVTQLSGQG